MKNILKKIRRFGRHNEKGEEILDPTPMALTVGFTRPLTLEERIASMVRGEMSLASQKAGFETFEDANDFDVDDESFDPSTPYEEKYYGQFEKEVEIESRHYESRDGQRYRKKQKAPPRQPDKRDMVEEQPNDKKRQTEKNLNADA